MSLLPGTIVLDVRDHTVGLDVEGGGDYELPVGPLELVAGPLEHADVPAPEQLTNAIALVQDHLDDLLIEAPSIAAAPAVVAAGKHARVLAMVELGADAVPTGYRLERRAADEVFRTLVVEPISDRVANPGLPSSHVESIIGTCCVILGVMRRLDLRHVDIAGSDAAPSDRHDDTAGR